MFTAIKIGFGPVLAVLAISTMLVANLPIPAEAGHGSPADQSRSFQKNEPEQCERRDTYNDIYYSNCVELYQQARDRIDYPASGKAVQGTEQLLPSPLAAPGLRDVPTK
jgi:hypothetical protein